jgi:hypothetical protein
VNTRLNEVSWLVITVAAPVVTSIDTKLRGEKPLSPPIPNTAPSLGRVARARRAMPVGPITVTAAVAGSIRYRSPGILFKPSTPYSTASLGASPTGLHAPMAPSAVATTAHRGNGLARSRRKPPNRCEVCPWRRRHEASVVAARVVVHGSASGIASDTLPPLVEQWVFIAGLALQAASHGRGGGEAADIVIPVAAGQRLTPGPEGTRTNWRERAQGVANPRAFSRSTCSVLPRLGAVAGLGPSRCHAAVAHRSARVRR